MQKKPNKNAKDTFSQLTLSEYVLQVYLEKVAERMFEKRQRSSVSTDTPEYYHNVIEVS
jgi:hypothetical protein